MKSSAQKSLLYFEMYKVSYVMQTIAEAEFSKKGQFFLLWRVDRCLIDRCSIYCSLYTNTRFMSLQEHTMTSKIPKIFTYTQKFGYYHRENNKDSRHLRYKSQKYTRKMSFISRN